VSGIAFMIDHICALMQFIEEMHDIALVCGFSDVGNQDKFGLAFLLL
jgi:hypothetical protein